MPKFTVEGIVFHSEDLTEEGRHLLTSLQVLETEMQRLDLQIRVFEDVNTGLLRSLEATLPRIGDDGQE